MTFSGAKQSRLLLYEEGSYTSDRRIWQVSANVEAVVLYRCAKFHFLDVVTFLTLVALATVLSLYFRTFLGLREWVSVALILELIPFVLALAHYSEIRSLKKRPNTVLRITRTGECVLYYDEVHINLVGEPNLDIVSDYCPSFYEGERYEGSFTTFHELHLVVGSDRSTTRYPLMGSVSRAIVDTVKKQLMSGWETVQGNRTLIPGKTGD